MQDGESYGVPAWLEKRPFTLSVVCFAIIIGVVFMLGRLNNAAPKHVYDEAASLGWSSDVNTLAASLRLNFPDRSAKIDAGWSPPIDKKDGVYRAIWLDADDQADRFEVTVARDAPSYVQAVTLTEGASHIGDDAPRFVSAVLPGLSAAETRSTGVALASISDDKGASITVHGIRFSASSGWIHATLRAEPAA